MKKYLLLVVLSLSFAFTQAQEIRLGVWQDARLAVTEDSQGRDPFTLDILTKVKLIGDDMGAGYLVVSPFYEYADLEIKYQRFGFDVGFTFDEFLWGIEVTPSVNYSIIDREGRGYQTFGADLEASIPITDKLRLSVLAQGVDRKDLSAYNDRKFLISGFVGIQYVIFKR